MSKVILFQPELHRKRARLQPVAGAGKRVENQHQGPRIVRAFLAGYEPGELARREQVQTRLVTKVLRERLAEHEFGRAA